VNTEEALSKLVEILAESDRTLVRATIMDYFAAHAPAMPQFWRSKYIEQASVNSMSFENLTIEAKWRWAYAKAMVEQRPKQGPDTMNSIEVVKL
jgi:hypothetical protein